MIDTCTSSRQITDHGNNTSSDASKTAVLPSPSFWHWAWLFPTSATISQRWISRQIQTSGLRWPDQWREAASTLDRTSPWLHPERSRSVFFISIFYWIKRYLAIRRTQYHINWLVQYGKMLRLNIFQVAAVDFLHAELLLRISQLLGISSHLQYAWWNHSNTINIQTCAIQHLW